MKREYKITHSYNNIKNLTFRCMAEDAIDFLYLFRDHPPVGLKMPQHKVVVVATGEQVLVNWDGTKATMVWPEDK